MEWEKPRWWAPNLTELVASFLPNNPHKKLKKKNHLKKGKEAESQYFISTVLSAVI